MRAVLISNGFQPDYEAGFANGLAANGVQVTLISSYRTLVDKLAPGIAVLSLRASQDEGRPAWIKALNILRYYFRLLALVAQQNAPVHLTGMFTLSHLNRGWADRTWFYECWLLRLLSKRLILTVHNVVPHDRDTLAMRKMLSRIYELPDRLVVHTQRTRQRLIDEFGVPSDRILVMEHGINELVPPNLESIAATRSGLGVAANQRLVLFFGIVQHYKGVDLLLDAARRFSPQVRLVIAGYCGDAQYGQELLRMMSVHPMGERLSWENAFLPESRVSELLSAADVLVMPYRHIDQSGVLFAGLRHGVPLVAFDVGSLRDYLPEGVGKVVPLGDLDAFASVVETIEPSSSARDRVLAVAERYLWSHTVLPVLNEYKGQSR